MKLMLRHIALIAILFATAQSAWSAPNKPLPLHAAECRGCVSTRLFQEAAKDYYLVANPVLYNLSTGAIHTYQVRLKPGYPNVPDPPPESLAVYEIATNPDIANALFYASEFFNLAGGRMKAGITVHASELGAFPGSDGANAYRVTEDANLRGFIGQRLVTNAPRWALMQSYASLAGQLAARLLNLSDTPAIRINVIFDDGSSVVFTKGLDQPDPNMAIYEPGSAKTPKKQVVPDANSVQYQGTWYAPPHGGDPTDRFAEHINIIGGSATGGSGQQNLVCRWKNNSSGGGTLICAPYVN
jgi:hypothetical protein